MSWCLIRNFSCDAIRLFNFDYSWKLYKAWRMPQPASVTRFGEILPLWQKFVFFGNFLTVYFVFGKILMWLWQICDIIGLICIVANDQILKNNLTIWSHCSQPKAVKQGRSMPLTKSKQNVSKEKTCDSTFIPCLSL